MTSSPIPGPELPGDAADVDKLSSLPPITPGEEKAGVDRPFFSFMQEGKGTPPMALSGKAAMISPFDLPQGGMHPATATPTFQTLISQVNNAQSTMGDLSTFLNTPGLKLKSKDKLALKNRMADANSRLRAANTRLGAEVPEPPEASHFTGPIGRFLAFISDGQQLLESAKSHLENLKAKGESLQPGDFLLIQVKLNKAQQELEYSSVLLATVVAAFKQLMQTQL